MSDKFEATVILQLEKLNQKVDRLNSILMRLPTTHQSNLGDWLTEEQAKELLQLGATSLWGHRKTGKFTFSKIGGRIYYSRESILNYLKENESK